MTATTCRALVALLAATALLLPAHGRAQQQGIDIQGVGVLPVQGAVTMLAVDGGNVAVQVGADGVLLVDPRTEATVGRVMAAVRSLSDRPVHTIIDTHADPEHTGGNQAVVKMRGTGAAQEVRVMAHSNVLRRLQAAGQVSGFQLNAAITVPINSTYDEPRRDFYLNGESIVLYHEPAAHTDGDTVVHFRRSDVLAVGDLFVPDRYPEIDLDEGGSIHGVIAALNHILELTVPARFQEGGTYVIPGHGRLCDEADVVEVRNMATIVRDRVQALVDQGLSLEQVQAAGPSRDYDTEYGGGEGRAAGARFVESIYRSLTRAN